MVRHRVPHHEARVVVHEARKVEALVPPQEKREDVGLPELIRLRSLEAPRPVLVRLRLRPRLRHQPLLVQDPPHLRLAHPEPLEARQYRLDPSRPVLRVLLAHLRHRGASRLPSRRVSLLPRPALPRYQRLHPSRPVGPQPLVDRLLRDPERLRQPRRWRSGLHPAHHPETNLHRVGHSQRLGSRPSQPLIRIPPGRRPLSLSLVFRHCRLSFPGPTSSQKARRRYLFSP
jgi:hypothetical protein